MSADGIKIVMLAVVWILSAGIIANMVFFFANLKIYTEIMKEKSQRTRATAERQEP